ncbi:hypothetical protein B0A55_05454 [Friedmanniomyces simplex]|uniref:Uncharacterized protein n=1 Tax=Friedmanniomyces simplex TaxID=329884 RepID=A0A4U0XC65_9PEZI|nr:hypothetical protein B0A55_05454 [Friedmanniomyces simplex]
MADEQLKDKTLVERVLATTPLLKVGSPTDVARQIAVDASPTLSRPDSGVNIMVDGV